MADAAMDDGVGNCWHCGQALAAAAFGREQVCTGCGRATRVCRNCRFHRPGMSNDCQEPIADHVADKTRANFCDYFEPGNTAAPSGATGAPDDLLAAAEALFRGAD